MRAKRDTRLDVRKIMKDLEEYEKSPARGGLRIAMPVEDAVKKLAKARPERQNVNRPSPKRRTP